MALRDWIFRAIKDNEATLATATVATVATHDEEKPYTVAEVAIVAVASMERVIDSTPMATTIGELLCLHKPFVLGCKLIDVLNKADITDYNDLRNTEFLEAFTQVLLNLGEIQIVETNSEGNK